MITISDPSKMLVRPEAVAASRAAKILHNSIKQFSDGLKNETDLVGATIIGSNIEPFVVRVITYKDPDWLIVAGQDANGNPVRLVQHYTQVGLLLTVIPSTEKRTRIGFHEWSE
ncbi:hypothetical protein [Devosia sp. MC1541]|uniref:hypothetical protein n=1 Tax=Devosia sp. MC1541 TaxID=2725264 RepID=UPI00145DA102|nr:hypothetical protein [Devosia sp. MC1541]